MEAVTSLSQDRGFLDPEWCERTNSYNTESMISHDYKQIKTLIKGGFLGSASNRHPGGEREVSDDYL